LVRSSQNPMYTSPLPHVCYISLPVFGEEFTKPYVHFSSTSCMLHFPTSIWWGVHKTLCTLLLSPIYATFPYQYLVRNSEH
jgi:hypothetical protein